MELGVFSMKAVLVLRHRLATLHGLAFDPKNHSISSLKISQSLFSLYSTNMCESLDMRTFEILRAGLVVVVVKGV